jgi:hypothetical protein
MLGFQFLHAFSCDRSATPRHAGLVGSIKELLTRESGEISAFECVRIQLLEMYLGICALSTP